MTTNINDIHASPPEDPSDRYALRRQALSDPVMRQEFYLSHPVVRDSLQVATAPVKQVFDAIQQLIVHRFPGSPFIGDFRMGKTQTIDMVCAELQEIFPKVAIGTLIAKHHDKPSEKAFFGDLLDDYQHGAALYGSAAERRRRVLRLIVAAVQSVGGDHYVFFIDEGQNWGVQEYVWVRDLTNDLKKLGIRSTTIVFAHAELQVLRDRLISTGRKDLLGRFFLTPHVFRGLRDLSELRETMAAFDNPARHEHPPGSGICMSEFFFPMAYEGGWRLAAEAPYLWAAFVRVAARQGRTAGNIGMQWVMSAIRAWLFMASVHDVTGFSADGQSWVIAVDSSEYQSSLQ